MPADITLRTLAVVVRILIVLGNEGRAFSDALRTQVVIVGILIVLGNEGGAFSDALRTQMVIVGILTEAAGGNALYAFLFICRS